MRAAALLIVAAALAGCSDPGSAIGFDEKDPAARMRAIHQAASTAGEVGREGAAIKPLIQRLESDDPAERLVAIHTLEGLTGETFGYEHSASRPDRQAAIRRWTDWYRDQQGNHPPTADH